MRIHNGNFSFWVNRVRECDDDCVGSANRHRLHDRVDHPGINRESANRRNGRGKRFVEGHGHGVAGVGNSGRARAKGVGKLCRVVRHGLGGNCGRVVSSAVLNGQVQAEKVLGRRCNIIKLNCRTPGNRRPECQHDAGSAEHARRHKITDAVCPHAKCARINRACSQRFVVCQREGATVRRESRR